MLETPGWLAEHLHQVVVVDLRWWEDGSGRDLSWPGTSRVLGGGLEGWLGRSPAGRGGLHPSWAGPGGPGPPGRERPLGRAVPGGPLDAEPPGAPGRLEAAGAALGRRIVTYCGSGISASALLYAVRRAGFGDAALYDASWEERGRDPERAVARG